MASTAKQDAQLDMSSSKDQTELGKAPIKIPKCLFHMFFAASSIFLLLTLALIVVQCCGADCSKCLGRVVMILDSESIKNIAMTVGLTGIMFTWLLQIIIDRECGQSMGKLFESVFPEVWVHLFLFLSALPLCIGFSSSKASTDMDLLIAGASFASALFSMINMWILCRLFLFSAKSRRYIAFLFLEKQVLRGGEAAETALLNWRNEMDRCIQEGETAYTVRFFSLLCYLRDVNFSKQEKQWSNWCFVLIRDILQRVEPTQWEKIPDFIHRKELPKQTDADCRNQLCNEARLLSIYVLALSFMFPERRSDRALWSQDIYRYVWHYLAERPAAENRLMPELLRVYCAFTAFQSFITVPNDAALKLIMVYSTNVSSTASEESKYEFESMKTSICDIDGTPEDETEWARAELMYGMLCALRIKTGDDQPLEEGSK